MYSFQFIIKFLIKATKNINKKIIINLSKFKYLINLKNYK